MPIYLCQLTDNCFGVIAAENASDAVWKYDAIWPERGKTHLSCTKLYRAEVLEWVERRLDGDKSISIVL